MGGDAVSMARRTRLERLPRQLEFWHDDVRAVAKCLANSALFSVRDKRAARAKYDNDEIASFNDVTIRYTGTQLDQDDHLVFMQLVHMARADKFGTPVVIHASTALAGLGWSDSQDSYDRLRDSYKRMLEGTVYVVDHQPKRAREYGSHLIGRLTSETTASGTVWSIVLDPMLATIMTGDEFTLINWVRQRRLSALAQWLHAFYATHDVPLPYKAVTLHERCGSKMTSPRAFRQKLKMALEELKNDQFLVGYDIGPRPSFLVTVARQLPYALV